MEKKTAKFDNLFGMPVSELQNVCVLAPFLHKGMLRELHVPELKKGLPYASGQGPGFTFIHSQIGASLTGDAVLQLKDSPCKTIIFLGACGLVERIGNLDVGSLVCPIRAFNFESFSDLLKKDLEEYDDSRADEELTDRFIGSAKDKNIAKVRCATFGSIVLEQRYQKELVKYGMDVVDMECSAFFAAATYGGLKAMALLYVTDVIAETSALDPALKTDPAVCRAQKSSTDLLLNFIPAIAGS